MTVQEKLGIIYAMYNCDICGNCVARSFASKTKKLD